jgi:hypothetical protein
MKKQDVGQAISILANIGVIAGILFLGLELRQNNQLLELQAESENRVRVNSIVELVIDNPDLSELMAKVPADLTPVEQDRLGTLGIRMLLNFEDLYRDLERGNPELDEAVRRLRTVWCRDRLNYGVRIAWDSYKPRAAPAFIEWMEEKIIGDGC